MRANRPRRGRLHQARRPVQSTNHTDPTRAMKLTLENLHMYADEEGGCLIWNQSTNSGGAPQARLDGGKNWLVRRYIVSVLQGKPLARYQPVSSTCDNPKCIAPGCLFPSTMSDVSAPPVTTRRQTRSARL